MYGKPMDIWALGCTFYQLIYNEFPFEVGVRPNDFMKSLLNDTVSFPKLSSGISLPIDCADLIQRMLDKEPATRITVAQILEHPYLRGSLSLLPLKTPNREGEKTEIDPTTLVANIFKKIISKKMVELKMKKQDEDPLI